MMRYLRILTGFPVWSLAVELEELQQAVGRTDPAAVLVSPRVLRRILQEEYKVPYLLVQAPHERCYFFDREVLFRHVEQDELEIEPDRLLPPTVILLARPTAERLESATADELLSRYWRLLFHCHVHMALEKRHAERANAEGDIVRAAILHTKAARVAPAALTQHTRTLALKDLERLTLNMQEGLKLNPEDVPQWLHVLPALLDKSDQGSWPVEA